MKNTWIIVAVVAIVVGGAAFFGGTKYAQGKSAGANNSFTGRMRQGQGAGTGNRMIMGAGAAGGFTSGEVLSKDDKSITVKLRDGGSKIILFSTSTPVRKMSEGSLNDVIVGSQVTVMGQGGSDGSIVASSIQLGDFGMMRMLGTSGKQRPPQQ